MFRYNLKANYQPDGGHYLQILSGKDLYKQTIVMSARTHDTFPARFPRVDRLCRHICPYVCPQTGLN